MSDNGDQISKFHELCDNKGNTLSLFHVKDEIKLEYLLLYLGIKIQGGKMIWKYLYLI